MSVKGEIFTGNDLEKTVVDLEDTNFDPEEITSRIFQAEIPVIPVIYLTENSDYSIARHISATAPYGYVIKHHKTPFNIDELKFTIEIAFYKYKIKNKKNSSDNKTKEALKESEEKFRTFIEQSIDGITLLDEKGRVIEWNKGNELITGIKKDKAIGKGILENKTGVNPT